MLIGIGNIHTNNSVVFLNIFNRHMDGQTKDRTQIITDEQTDGWTKISNYRVPFLLKRFSPLVVLEDLLLSN